MKMFKHASKNKASTTPATQFKSTTQTTAAPKLEESGTHNPTPLPTVTPFGHSFEKMAIFSPVETNSYNSSLPEADLSSNQLSPDVTGQGYPLPEQIQQKQATPFGHHFSSLRIHNGTPASSLNGNALSPAFSNSGGILQMKWAKSDIEKVSQWDSQIAERTWFRTYDPLRGFLYRWQDGEGKGPEFQPASAYKDEIPPVLIAFTEKIEDEGLISEEDFLLEELDFGQEEADEILEPPNLDKDLTLGDMVDPYGFSDAHRDFEAEASGEKTDMLADIEEAPPSPFDPNKVSLTEETIKAIKPGISDDEQITPGMDSRTIRTIKRNNLKRIDRREADIEYQKQNLLKAQKRKKLLEYVEKSNAYERKRKSKEPRQESGDQGRKKVKLEQIDNERSLLLQKKIQEASAKINELSMKALYLVLQANNLVDDQLEPTIDLLNLMIGLDDVKNPKIESLSTAQLLAIFIFWDRQLYNSTTLVLERSQVDQSNKVYMNLINGKSTVLGNVIKPAESYENEADIHMGIIKSGITESGMLDVMLSGDPNAQPPSTTLSEDQKSWLANLRARRALAILEMARDPLTALTTRLGIVGAMQGLWSLAEVYQKNAPLGPMAPEDATTAAREERQGKITLAHQKVRKQTLDTAQQILLRLVSELEKKDIAEDDFFSPWARAFIELLTSNFGENETERFLQSTATIMQSPERPSMFPGDEEEVVTTETTEATETTKVSSSAKGIPAPADFKGQVQAQYGAIIDISGENMDCYIRSLVTAASTIYGVFSADQIEEMVTNLSHHLAGLQLRSRGELINAGGQVAREVRRAIQELSGNTLDFQVNIVMWNSNNGTITTFPTNQGTVPVWVLYTPGHFSLINRRG